MNKKITIIISILILILLIGGVALYGFTHKSKEDNPVKVTENTKFEKLKKAIGDSKYFENANFNVDEKQDRLTIDENYDIDIKSGYYLMRIKDTKDEEKYCEIVDAIEMSLGLPKGKSIETCRESLKGTINMGGINVEFNDSYKILTVNSTEPSSLYDISKSHSKDELISIDELNYNIKFDDYLLTSMSAGYTEEVKIYALCGNIYNSNKKSETLKFTIYDNNKNKLDEVSLLYENNSNKYISFCADFENNLGNAKYYSVNTME